VQLRRLRRQPRRASCYTRVDQHNTLGLGNDVPISTGNENDALLTLVEGEIGWCCASPIRYAKGLDGRIDDPNAGWKGRGNRPMLIAVLA
jgi:hypothetical protein